MRIERTDTPVVVVNCQLAALAIMRSLGPHGVPLYAVDGNRAAPAMRSRYCTDRFVIPFSEDRQPEFLEGLRGVARKIGRMIVNIATDKPWSQYFCCMVFGNREFVRDHPVATKRFLRAILKATDMCAAEPERTAQRLVDAGFPGRYEYALQTLTELPYARWREFDPDDSLRFYALRLHEVGMIKSSPNAIIADGTDWRFLNELKRELKA